MDSTKSSEVLLDEETKTTNQLEKPQVEINKQSEDPATEVQVPEIDKQLNGNEIQSSGTEQELPVKLKSQLLHQAPDSEAISNAESVPDNKSLANVDSESNIESVPEIDPVTNAQSEPNSIPKTEYIPNVDSVSNPVSKPNAESEVNSNSEPNVELGPKTESEPNSIPKTESIPNVDSVSNPGSEPNAESEVNSNSGSIVELVPKTESEPIADSELNPEVEHQVADPESNVESGDCPASESPKSKAETPVQNQKRGFKSPKDGNCDKYGWPIGSKYCTEVQDSSSGEKSSTEDAEGDIGEGKEKEKDESADVPKEDEEILYVVTSPVNKRANMKRTVINVEEVEGAITDGIHAGTHFPHFLTYLSQRIKFRLTISRFPDKKLRITIKFGGNGGDTLKQIVCLWLCREDEDKDKIVCQGLTRNKEEMLILLAQKFQEIEHIKDDPIALFEEIKQLVPELRGKQGLRSEDQAFLSAYQELDEKVRTLMAILYREGCKREGQNEQTLAQFRDMYFSLQIKPGFTVKQYLWAFYYYNLIFAPHICRDLETLMQKYAASKNITLPSTSTLIFPPGGQTSTVINPFAKKNLSIAKDSLKEIGALSSDGFISPEGEQFRKPMNPKQRTAQRRRQANQRNRKADAGNNKGNLTNPINTPNQRIIPNQRNSLNQRSPSNQRNNPRNQSNQRNPSNQRDSLNQRNPQTPRNSNQRSPANQGSQPVQRSPANKRRPGSQGGPANKKRSVNPGVSSFQGGPPISGVPAFQGNQPNQNKPANIRRKPPGQRNNQPNQLNQRNNQPNLRNNQPNQRINLPTQRNNQPNQRNNQPNQRNNQTIQRGNQRNSGPRRRSDVRSHEQNREQNFSMDMQRNHFSSPNNQDFLSLNVRNNDFMQHNDLRNQDFRRSQNFSNNQRTPNFSQSTSRNQNFSQGNHSRNNSFSQSSNPRSLFSQDFFDMPHNQSFSPNNSMGRSFSEQDSQRMPARASDFFGDSQDFFSGPSNFSNRFSSMNRSMDEMQFSGFNSRMSFGNEMNAQNFSNSSSNKSWDNKSSRGKRKNFRDGWSTKRQKQGT